MTINLGNSQLPTSTTTSMKRSRNSTTESTITQDENGSPEIITNNANTTTATATLNNDSPLSTVTSSSSSYIGSPVNFNRAYDEGLIIPYEFPTLHQHNDEQIPVFDPIIHLKYRNSYIPKSVDLKHLNLHDCYKNSYLEMVGDGSFPLFSQSCIDIMKWELTNYIKKLRLSKKTKNQQTSGGNNNENESNTGTGISGISSYFASPSLSNCEKDLPFSYQAWTHKETINAISAVSGIDLKICQEFEIAHFAERRKTTFNNSNNNNSGTSTSKSGVLALNKIKRHKRTTELLINRKSIAYPYICLVRLLPISDQDYSPLPPGHCVILQGRILENLAKKELDKQHSHQHHNHHHHQHHHQKLSFKQTGNYNIVSLATFQPENIIKYEDSKFFRNSFNYRSDLSKARRLLLTGTKGNNNASNSNRLIASGSSKIPRRKSAKERTTTTCVSESDSDGDGRSEDESFENVSSYIDWLQDYYTGKKPRNGSKLLGTGGIDSSATSNKDSEDISSSTVGLKP